ncbi:MAG: AEC family transporter [Firmicutes bacterium]|jgi:predicted permease|nr:AEC family transporter [Bacillota bacterium]
MYEELFTLLIMIFFMMLAGYILQRAGIVTAAGKKSLANIIIYLVLPCNIIKAFCMEISMEEIKAMSAVLGISVAIQVFYVALTKTLYNRFEDGEKQVYQYATVCSNAGFMGHPISQGVFGDLGLLYAAVFIIPQRIVMWTAGISYFTKASSKWEAVRKVALHPCIIAVYIGVILFLTQMSLPPVIDETLSGFSQCNTGMTMLYIGTVLADVNFRTLASKKQVYFAALRLVVIPAVVYGVLALASVDPLVTGVCVLMTAMPAGSTTAILAGKYDADEETAVKCVVFTTALSVITTPLWSILLTGGLA